MTLTATRSARQSPSGIDWTAIHSGLWVGHRDGEFAGMIETDADRGYLATTRLARSLGTFASVEEAKAALGEC